MRDFIWVKIDQRMFGAHKIAQRLRNDSESTIPWYAVLNADEELLFTSFDENGNNTGFPGGTDSREQFRRLLKTTTRKMTTEQIAEMLNELGL